MSLPYILVSWVYRCFRLLMHKNGATSLSSIRIGINCGSVQFTKRFRTTVEHTVCWAKGTEKVDEAAAKAVDATVGGAVFLVSENVFRLCKPLFPLDIENDNFFLKWILLLLSKRITIHIHTRANTSITSSGFGENIFSPRTTR